MAKRKVVSPPPAVTVETARTIPCPNHGQPLILQEQDGKLIAICTCDVKPNKHAGQPVVEMVLETKE